MKNQGNFLALLLLTLFVGNSAVHAQSAVPAKAANKQPIEISSDKLDVFQDQHKAIFTGNVVAVQGTTNMRAKQMTVYYNQDNSAPAAQNPSPAASAQGISRIEAEGSVVFTTPAETAQGELAIYHADSNTIELKGGNVTLTRDKNILKGTHLTYNMDTGRSILTAGAQTVSGGASKPTRVHGLFVPNAKEK